jgi:hexokinase
MQVARANAPQKKVDLERASSNHIHLRDLRKHFIPKFNKPLRAQSPRFLAMIPAILKSDVTF